MMFDFLIATLITCGGFLAMLSLSVQIVTLAGDAESAYLVSVATANTRVLEVLRVEVLSGAGSL